MSDTQALPLAGQHVLVTGASSGIGQAIARAAACAGADVTLTYRQNERGARELEGEIRALGRRSAVIRLDITDDRSLREVGPAASEALGELDVWVNNAGADILTGPNAELSDVEKLDLLLAVDLRGTMRASWQAAEILGKRDVGGVIINMSWDHVITGMPGLNPQLFAAVKGGVLSFSKSLARSVAPRIRVNVLAPGWIDTSFADGLDESRRQAVTDSTPLNRWGTAEDVANAAVFLASPAARFLTGQTLHIGGGVVMA